jgi:hypothetical protein
MASDTDELFIAASNFHFGTQEEMNRGELEFLERHGFVENLNNGYWCETDKLRKYIGLPV